MPVDPESQDVVPASVPELPTQYVGEDPPPAEAIPDVPTERPRNVVPIIGGGSEFISNEGHSIRVPEVPSAVPGATAEGVGGIAVSSAPVAEVSQSPAANEDNLIKGPDGRPLLPHTQQERVPGVNLPEGDPGYVDSTSPTVEHDYVEGGYGLAEAKARGEDFMRTDAARNREGAREIEGYQQGVDNLPPKGRFFFSKASRQRRKAERQLADRVAGKGHDMSQRPGLVEESIGDAMQEAPYTPPEDNKMEVENMRANAVDSDNAARISGGFAARAFNEQAQAQNPPPPPEMAAAGTSTLDIRD